MISICTSDIMTLLESRIKDSALRERMLNSIIEMDVSDKALSVLHGSGIEILSQTDGSVLKRVSTDPLEHL